LIIDCALQIANSEPIIEQDKIKPYLEHDITRVISGIPDSSDSQIYDQWAAA
jgi:hypothetical protein